MRVLKSFGFTMVEIMIVVIIIGILAGIAIPKFNHSIETAKCSQGMTVLSSLRNAELDWFRENAVFTTLISDLETQVGANFSDTPDWDFNTTMPVVGLTTVVLTATRLSGPHAAAGNDTLTINELGVWGGGYPYTDPGTW
ncbi:MAG: prepilin-type N-terminal cleavage/methylation domain-containing protein [Candidatus Omnitrophica bacterium]|nr:prepilin-type N-terminal cleavage/methylation domain-containing protein [Candidatus Omnitrophota bacterium]